MNILIIENNLIKTSESTFPIEDLYSDEFYEYCNLQSIQFYNESFCVNELYAHLAQPYLALEYYISKQLVDFIDITKTKGEYKLYLIDIAKKQGVHLIGNTYGLILWISVKAFFVRMASFFYLSYLMLKIPYTHEKIVPKQKFAILRQESAIQKFKHFKDIAKEYENPYDKASVYRFFSKKKRLGWVFDSYLKSASVLRDIKHFYGNLIGWYSAMQVDCFYQRRIVHSLLYKHLMDNYFSLYSGCTYYTGNNLDRFSVIEEKIARNHGVKTVCYPHGLEYGYKFPKGFSCDIFYTNSEFAANMLNKLYNTSKYLYDEAITRTMFEIQNVPPHEKHVVFFTEQQEYHVNKAILTHLQPMLKEINIKLLVKLHPGDKKEHYSDCDFIYISDYIEAITNNICISRKSTVLLEGVYNNSTSIAILTTKRDKSIFNLFPSLQSEKIIRTYNVQDLFNEIIKAY